MGIFDIFKSKPAPDTAKESEQTSLNNNNQSVVTQKPIGLQVGQPSNYPTQLVAELSALFSQRNYVNAAYLALVQGENDPQPRLLIGLDISVELNTVTAEAGPIADRYLAKGENIYFIQINDKGGIMDYLTKQTTPFYLKRS